MAGSVASPRLPPADPLAVAVPPSPEKIPASNCSEAGEREELLNVHTAGTGPPRRQLMLVLVCVVTMNATWVFMGEAIQGVGTNWPHFYAQAFVVSSSYSYCLFAWAAAVRFSSSATRWNPTRDWRSTAGRVSGAAVLSVSMRTLWYVSLAHTNAAANSACYQSTMLWAYFFSIPLLREPADWAKLLSLGLCVAGCALVAVFTTRKSEDDVDQTVAGYIFLFGSVFIYALYSVYLKRFAYFPGSENHACDTLLFTGITGVVSFLAGLLVFPALHYTGAERFDFPSHNDLTLLLVNGVCDAVFQAALVLCVVLTSPSFSCASAVFVVPITALFDWILHDYVPAAGAAGGMLLIFAGFAAFLCRTRQHGRHGRWDDLTKCPPPPRAAAGAVP